MSRRCGEGVVDDPAERAASLDTVEAEAQRLDRLVGDILDLAKLDTHRFTVTTEEVDMGSSSTRLTSGSARKRAGGRSSIARRCWHRPVITSDGDRVLQVVGNLLSNAFHATPDGGRISLELGQRNGTVHVAVEDNGPGIPAEMRERLFRPFVSQTGGGTGLGLAIAKELSAMLGGRHRPRVGGRQRLAVRAVLAGARALGERCRAAARRSSRPAASAPRSDRAGH